MMAAPMSPGKAQPYVPAATAYDGGAKAPVAAAAAPAYVFAETGGSGASSYQNDMEKVRSANMLTINSYS